MCGDVRLGKSGYFECKSSNKPLYFVPTYDGNHIHCGTHFLVLCGASL